MRGDAMTSAADRALARLREAWGERWQVWYVPTVVGPWVWAAKRLDDHGTASLINVHSPDDLAEALAEAEAGAENES